MDDILKQGSGGYDSIVKKIYEHLHEQEIDFLESMIVSTFRSFGYNVNTSWEFICNQRCIESETAKKIAKYVNESLKVFYEMNNMLTPVSISFPTKAFNSANIEMYDKWKDMWIRVERTYNTMLRARDDDFAEF